MQQDGIADEQMSAELATNVDYRAGFRSGLLVAIEILIVVSLCGYYLLPKGQANYFPTYLLGILVLVLIANSRQDRSQLLNSRIFLVAATFAGYLALSSLWSGGSTTTGVAKAFADWLLVVTMLGAIVILASQAQHRMERIGSLLLAAATLSALYFLYGLWGDEAATPWGRLATRSVGAMVYGFAAILAINGCAARQSMAAKAALAGCAVVLLGAVYACHMHYVWLGVTLAISAQIAVHLWEQRRTKLTYVLAPLLVVSLIAALYCLSLVLTSERQLMWRSIVTAAFKAHAFVGHGILEDAIPKVDCNSAVWIRDHFANCFLAHPHNIYISTLFYGGIVGVFLLLLTLLMAFGFVFERNLLHSRATVFALLTYGCTVLMFDGNKLLTKIDFTWLLFWLPVGLAAALELTRRTDD